MNNISNNQKKCFILETASRAIELDKPNSTTAQRKYVFSGPCAEFGVLNGNGRIYDKEDYLKHVVALQKDIEANRLLGEVDHDPNDLDPKRAKESHIIKKLWYNEELNQVWITIEIINNSRGKDIMAAVDQGVPIYISSRASGYIDDQNHVVLDGIYTYDIVYRPGFEIAKLERVMNESLGIHNNNILILEKKEIMENNITTEETKEFVTKGELETYSQKVLESVENIIKTTKSEPKKQIAETKVILESVDKIVNSQEDLDRRFEAFVRSNRKKNGVNEIYESKFNSFRNDQIKIVESLNEVVDFINVFGKKMTKIEEQLNGLHSFNLEVTNSIKELNENDFVLKEGIEKGINILNESATTEIVKLKDVANKNKSILENSLNLMVEKEAILEEKIIETEKLIDSQHYQGMNENQSVVFVKLLGKRENQEFSKIKINEEKAIGNSILPIGVYTKTTDGDVTYLVNESGEAHSFNTRILESKLTLTETVNRIDEMVKVHNLKKKENEKNILENQYPFILELNQEDRNLFESLTTVYKEKIGEEVKANTINESNISEKIQFYHTGKGEPVLQMLEGADSRATQFYNSLDKENKESLLNSYVARDIQPGYQTEVFWESVLAGSKNVNKLQSKNTPVLEGASNSLGYSDDVINQIIN
jgi:hypothetical protein